MIELTQEVVKELLDYKDGKLFWKPRDLKFFKDSKTKPEYTAERQMKRWNAIYAGTEAFTANGPKGYKHGAIFHKNYRKSRVVFYYFHGYWPEQVDHENGNNQDDRIENLREVDNAANCKNQSLHKNNTSGYPGVSWHKIRQKWQVRVMINGKESYCGIYDSLEEAITKRQEVEKQNGYHKNHGRAKK